MEREESKIDVKPHEWMTVQQVAELLGCHRTTVYNYIHSGKLKARLVGGVIRIDKDGYHAFIDGEPLYSTTKKAS